MESYSEIQKQIRKTVEAYETIVNTESHLDEIEAKLKETYLEVERRDKALDKELADLDKLEKVSVKSIFHSALGNKEQQLEKERQEYLEASLKFNEARKMLELLEFERDVLRKKIGQKSEVKARLDNLKNLRENEILNGPQYSLKKELQQISHDLDVCYVLNKELNEALEEGEKSVKLLEIVRTHLRKASNWGTWDMFGDNSRASDYMKHSAIDNAMNYLHKTQHQLNIFTRELRDLGNRKVSFQLDMVHFNRFTDFFFDNLISDWIVQQRIKSTLNNIEGTLSHVQRLVMSLQQELRHADEKMRTLELQKEKILTS